MLIILQMLHEGASQSLDDRPNCLAVGNERIKDAPDILDGHIVEQHNFTRTRINGDVSGMRPVTERLCSRVFEMSRHIDDFTSLGYKPSKAGKEAFAFRRFAKSNHRGTRGRRSAAQNN